MTHLCFIDLTSPPHTELAVARIDAFADCLRERQLRHVVVAKLDLLTHLLPSLLHPHVPEVSHGNQPIGAVASASANQSRSPGDAIRRRGRNLHLAGQRRRGRKSAAAAAPAAIAHSSHSPRAYRRALQKIDESEEDFAKQQPPPSVESLQDSGIGSSKSSIQSGTSPVAEETVTMATAPSPADERVDEGISGDEVSPDATPIKLRRYSHPVITPGRLRSTSFSSTPDKCLNFTPVKNGSVATPRRTLTPGGSRPGTLALSTVPAVENPANCCIPR